MHRIKTLTNRVARDPLAAQEVPAADLETDQATVLGHHWSSREGTRLAWPAEVAVTRYRYRGHRIPLAVDGDRNRPSHHSTGNPVA
jgi:hypothetical protein